MAARAPDPGTAAPANPQIEALAQARFVDSFLDQSGRSQLRLLPVQATIAYLWSQGQGLLWPVLWLMAAASMTVWRYFRTEAFVRRPDPRDSTRRIATLLLAGGMMLALPTLGFSAFSEFGRAALTMTLLVVGTVSVITTSGFRAVFMAYVLPLTVPLVVAWSWHAWSSSSPGSLLLALCIVLYLSFLNGIGKHANAVFLESCAYRFGEQQLNAELKQALIAADEANRAKTQFLAAASHDLRQPIHSMNVLVAALSVRPLDPSTQEIVSLLGAVNQILSKQLDTLLDVSKLDAGVVRAELAPQRLDQILKAHHAATAPVAAQRGLHMELDAPDELWVHTDGALLTRALYNLTDNAIKYTPHGGLVRLVARREGANAVMEVTDTGIGIADDEQPRVFREFYQVANVERDRSKGLGLGLSIVQRLCALLSIQVSLQSRPSFGTTVQLRLPLVSPGAEPALPSPARSPAHGLSVLVVDDEAMVRESTRLLLQGLGCTVYLAEGVDDAGEVARDAPLDMVLSDLRLRGGLSGVAAIEAVRRHRPEVKAALVTGDTAPGRIRDAEAAGVTLLFKPVTLQALLAALPAAPAPT